MNKNYYDYLNKKIQKMDNDISKLNNKIEKTKHDVQNLESVNESKGAEFHKQNLKYDRLLELYKNNGYKTIIAKKDGEIQPWDVVYIKHFVNNHLIIENKDGENLGEIVGNKSKKVKLLMKEFESCTCNVVEISEETITILIRFS